MLWYVYTFSLCHLSVISDQSPLLVQWDLHVRCYGPWEIARSYKNNRFFPL